MSDVTCYPAGAPSWVELQTPDAEASRAFYTKLFGWDYDIGGPEANFYSVAKIRDRDAAGIFVMIDEMRAGGVPPNWGTYVTVENVDATASKAKGLGGTLLTEPFDVMEYGRMCHFRDPTGAVIAAWQAKKQIGASVVNEPGVFCWNELATRDVEAATAFYTGVFGWTAQHNDGPMEYTEFKVDDNAVAGMRSMGEQEAGIPPNWLTYFTVADCDATVETAKSAGANVNMAPTDLPDIGRMSVLADPQGAVFAVIKTAAAPV